MIPGVSTWQNKTDCMGPSRMNRRKTGRASLIIRGFRITPPVSVLTSQIFNGSSVGFKALRPLTNPTPTGGAGLRGDK